MNAEATKRQDIEFTHALLNYAHAAFQGRYTFYNILDQLNFKDLPLEEIERSRKVIDRLARWISQLWKGEIVFYSNWTKAESFEAENVVELLENLRPELERLANATLTAISSKETPNQPEQVKLLIAAYGRNAYSKENYIRGLLEFGSILQISDLVAQSTELLNLAKPEIERTNFFLSSYKNPQTLDANFFGNLSYSCMLLPAVLRSHIHDISQLISQFKGGFSFSAAGIPDAEVSSWEAAQFSPGAAGYWRAYGMGPQEALAWINGGFNTPTMAAEWKFVGIPPNIAPLWATKGFNPATALPWIQAGIDPDQALNFIKDGITDPAKLR